MPPRRSNRHTGRVRAGKPRRARLGRSLEALIAVLERALGGQQGVEVESPKRIPDRLTGALREHDVVLTATAGHHTTVIAIECRDRSRKVTVNDVESFHSKCEDTKISVGVMVSPKGFTGTALKKAAHHSIRCLSLTQATAFNWLLAPGIQVLERNILHTHVLVQQGHDPELKFGSITVLMDGDPVPIEQMAAFARAEFEKLPPSQFPEGSGKHAVRFMAPRGMVVRDDETAQHYDVVSLLVTFDYEIKSTFVPFELMQYADIAGDEIASAAVAAVRTGRLNGRMLFVNRPGQGLQPVFVVE